MGSAVAKEGSPLRVHWIIPTRVAPGSGGMRTIVQVVSELASRGHEVTVSVSHEAYDPAEVEGVLCESYGMRGARVVAKDEVPARCDLAVATEWRTALPVKRLDAKNKAYFVQDFEPWFMPMGYEQIQARLSYTYGFKAVCIGRWLPHKLADEAGMSAASFDFGVDTSVYRPLDGTERKRAICAVYQPEDKPRRCGRLLLEAMRIVHQLEPDVDINYFGSGWDGQELPGYPGKVRGVLAIDECNRLYNECSVGICLSASNPSRVPFEMMAAGLPVIDLHVQNNVYDAIEAGELLASPTPEDLAAAVLSLLADDGRRDAMGKAGASAMAGRAIENEAKTAADLLECIGRGGTPDAGWADETSYSAEAFSLEGSAPEMAADVEHAVQEIERAEAVAAAEAEAARAAQAAQDAPSPSLARRVARKVLGR